MGGSVVREVGGWPGKLDCHRVPEGRHCGGGRLSAVHIRISWGFETVPQPPWRITAMIARPCCQQGDILSLDVMGPSRLERTLD